MGFMKFDAIPEAKYLCDTIEDLSTLLPRPSYGDTCWVISEACEYICNSKGEWLPKEKASKTTANVDLTGYATEAFVQEQIQNIEHPTVEVPSKLSELENDANYAQQSYVDTKVADLVNSAPETLDTIGEIAQALKDHQDVADAITEAIGKKADKEDLPSIEGLASEAFVTEAIQKIEFPVTDLSNYYTRDEVTQAIVDNAELPEGGLAHQYLVVDANGNKTWETQTHYLEERIVTNVAETTGTGRYIPYYVTHGLKLGKEYTITHNGVEYKCTSVEFSGDVILGNLGMGGIPGATDTGEPFVFLGSKTDNVYVQYAIFKDNIEHTFSIEGPSDIATQLSDKFIPPTVPKTTFGDVGDTVVITEAHHGAPVKWTAAKLPKKLSDLENDIKFIDQEYVDTKVAELVDNAPETLNTLKEVADALNENASVAEALNQAIGNKVDKTDYPTESSPNQYLTTNENGEKVWEEKLAYIDYEEKLFIAESIWDGTQLSFPVAELEANNGDRCSIYLDDIEYKGTIVNSLHTYTVEFDEGVSFPWPYFNIAKPGYNSNIGGEPITWLVGKLRATIQLSTPHTINSKYLNFDIQSTGKYDLIINNYNGTGSAHANSVSINGGVAEGEQSIALSYASKAQGIGSLAAGPSTAKGTYSVALGAGTTANSRGSISFGEQNIEDVNKKYVMIAGNGHTDINFSTGQMTEVYSNAYTLDWNGNARFAGDVYIQGTDVNDLQDAKKVATEEYVENKYLQKNETYTKSLSFNGEIEGKEVFGDFFYKVSDDTPALEDWAGHSLFFEDGSEAFIDDMYQGPLNSYPNDGYNINNMVIVFYNDVEGVASKGIYFEWIDFGKVAGANYTAHKTVIPEELLDSNLVRATAFNELTDTVKGLDKYCAFMKQGDQIRLGNVKEYSKMQEMLSGANKFHATLAVTYVNEEGLLILETCYAKSVMSTVDMSDDSKPYVNFSFETFAGETIRFKWNSDNTISDVSITKNLTEEDINTLIEAKIAPVE